MKKKKVKKLSIKKTTLSHLSGYLQQQIKGGVNETRAGANMEASITFTYSVFRACTDVISDCVCPTIQFSCTGSARVCCA